MYRMAIVAAVALSACLPFRKGEDADQRERTRICVRNATAGYGNVIARVGLARYDIMPGQEVCRVSMETGANIVLSARTIGGGANGPLTFNATLQAGAPGCWLWVLDNSRAYAGHLRECDDKRQAFAAAAIAGSQAGPQMRAMKTFFSLRSHYPPLRV